MMTRNLRRQMMVACLSAMLGALSGLTHAACTQANLRGTWYVMGVSADTADSQMAANVRCKFWVNSLGTLIASGSSCYFRNSSGLSAKNITSGSFKLSTACAVTGSFRMCQSGTCDTLRLQHAQMTGNWNTFSLVGYSVNNPDVVYFMDAVKR